MTGNSDRKIFFLLFFLTLTGFSFAADPDSIPSFFDRYSHFTEKLYIQHDKSFYTAGEDIRFRIYKVDGTTLSPNTFSRYVYVELINPVDSLVSRIKIKPEDNIWEGYIPLREDLAEGEYQLRAYTLLMESSGSEYFFSKPVYISTPLAVTLNPEFSYAPGKRKNEVDITLHFRNSSGKINLPKTIDIKDKKNQIKTVESLPDSTFHFIVNRKDFHKELLHLSYTRHTLRHSQYLPIPETNPDYDIQFFPEGGQLVPGNKNKIAFKAINSTGLGEYVEGAIYNKNDSLVASFRSEHKGMGSFDLFVEENITYYAICRNKNGQEKKFPLSRNYSNTYSLKIEKDKNEIGVSLLTPVQTSAEQLWLTIQTRGKVIYSGIWDTEYSITYFDENDLPAGIIHFILSDVNNHIVSERLFFSMNPAYYGSGEITFDKPEYTKRDKIDLELSLSDHKGHPLEASLSIAVTDLPDKEKGYPVNILSTLLLSSELKGYIEEPVWYFTDVTEEKRRLLDILMLTQGWRRYPVQDIMQGKIVPPKGVIEIGPSLSGKVKDGILMSKKGRSLPVSLLSTEPVYMEETQTDEQGKFYFTDMEFPDSMTFILQAFSHRGGKRVELEIDERTFPEINNTAPLLYNPQLFIPFLEQKQKEILRDYSDMWTIHLDDVIVEARPLGKSPYSSRLNKLYTSEDLKNAGTYDINEILKRENGIIETWNGELKIRDEFPAIIIDGKIWNMEGTSEYEKFFINLSDFKIDNIDQIEIVRDTFYSAYLQEKGYKTAILITTKTGRVLFRPTPSFNIKNITPLGFQQKKEFYSPKYETTEEKNNNITDWRSTIFWSPDIRTDNTGKTSVHFYSSDNENTQYNIIIEGITEDGKLIYHSEPLTIGKLAGE